VGCDKPQEGHLEKRKKGQSTWTIEVIENMEADVVAGKARLGAKQDEEVWEGKVSSWNKSAQYRW
jgi:hypothetical protein